MLMGKFLLFIFLLGSWELWSGEKGENFRSQFNIIMYSQTNVESQITLTTLYGKKNYKYYKIILSDMCKRHIKKQNTFWQHIKI